MNADTGGFRPEKWQRIINKRINHTAGGVVRGSSVAVQRGCWNPMASLRACLSWKRPIVPGRVH